MKIKTEDLDAVMGEKENRPYKVEINPEFRGYLDKPKVFTTRPAKRWAGILNGIQELPEITGVITPAKGCFIIRYKTATGDGTLHLIDVPESVVPFVLKAIRETKGGARWI